MLKGSLALIRFLRTLNLNHFGLNLKPKSLKFSNFGLKTTPKILELFSHTQFLYLNVERLVEQFTDTVSVKILLK